MKMIENVYFFLLVRGIAFCFLICRFIMKELIMTKKRMNVYYPSLFKNSSFITILVIKLHIFVC